MKTWLTKLRLLNLPISCLNLRSSPLTLDITHTNRNNKIPQQKAVFTAFPAQQETWNTGNLQRKPVSMIFPAHILKTKEVLTIWVQYPKSWVLNWTQHNYLNLLEMLPSFIWNLPCTITCTQAKLWGVVLKIPTTVQLASHSCVPAPVLKKPTIL